MESLAGAEAGGQQQSVHADLTQTAGNGRIIKVGVDIRLRAAFCHSYALRAKLCGIGEDGAGFPAVILQHADKIVAGDGEKFIFEPVLAEESIVAEIGAFLNAAKRAAADALAEHNNSICFGKNGKRIVLRIHAFKALFSGKTDQVDIALLKAVSYQFFCGVHNNLLCVGFIWFHYITSRWRWK